VSISKLQKTNSNLLVTKSVGNNNTNNSRDARIERILEMIVRFTQGHFDKKETVSDEGDELDAIVIGLNTLAEELQASGTVIRDYHVRVQEIMDKMLSYTLGDFSTPVKVSDIGDELDAIAIGLNTLNEELKTARENEQRQLKKISESEENFRILVSQVKDYAIIMIDPEGNIASWNDGAENIKGYNAEEIIGKNISIFYTPQDIRRNEPPLNLEIARKNGHYESKGWRKKKNGSLFYADVIYTALYDDAGKLKGYSKVTRDITEQKTTEDNLKSTNEFLDTILENIPNMVFVKDAQELRFLRFNKAGEDLLGYSREQMIGMNDYDFFPKEQADFFTKNDKDALNRKTVTDIQEEEIETAQGKKWLHTKKIPIMGNDGKPEYLLGISEDITVKKAINDKIRDLNNELQENVELLKVANDELEAFTYSVSHDLRAPLRAIHGYTNILDEEYADKLDEEGKRMMKSVMRNAKRMGQLIDDLLTLSRLGKKELVKRPTNLTDLMNQCLSDIKMSTDVSKAKITIDELGIANVDPALMFQVFCNLLSNAIKYSSAKEHPVIHVGVEKNEDESVYFIRDNGTGFDMKYYDKLFGVFQRLHSMEEFEGTGVGLALVKRIVTRHHGKVWAEGRLHEGATFYVALKTE
jgi:PAS domain S-box-containing protein